ncbi:hypothetical protein PG996_012957 [Apiospora saccharicola]|uniref:Uncharacterized protein n=1 Tax=Apiospora saccharicola TaxID=335842 RepID=A0ABR1U456_9PEZI
MLSLDTAYPLKEIKESKLQRLCTLLWDWEICEACRKGRQCQERDCPWQRSSKLDNFFAFYKEVTSSYVPELLAGSPAALRSHDDLLDLIEIIKNQPIRPRAELIAAYFAQREGTSKSSRPADQHRAVNLAVQAISVVSCPTSNRSSSEVLELGSLPVVWPDGVGFGDFMCSAFPQLEARRIQPEVRSSSPTTAILAQVSREVLHSIQVVLFPFNSDSEVLLRSLVRKASLDPDCAQYGFAVGGDDLAYSCFGSKLMDLYDEVDNPSPRGFVEKWFERKSGARYVMMATFIGVIIAVILGILSLAVGLFQSWVAYEAWKHPVSIAD